MDVKNNKGKYLKLLKFLREKKLAILIQKRKGLLPQAVVEKAQRAVNSTYSESSVSKLGTILQKYWEKILEDVRSNEPDECIITISRANIGKVKEEACEAVANYVVKTKDSDFLKGKINFGMIKKALMEHRGVSCLNTNSLNYCRLHVHANYQQIKEKVMKRLQTEEYSDFDSNWSEVSDYDDPVPGVSALKKAKIEKMENDSFDEVESVMIKKEAIENEQSVFPLKELTIPLERVKIPAKKEISVKSEKNQNPNQREKQNFSPWFRIQSDEEYLHIRKSEFLAYYRQKEIKLINDVQMAVQSFITDFDPTVQELFTNIQKHYRRQPSVKAL